MSNQKHQLSAKNDEIDFGWLKINNDSHRVLVNENEITLTNKEYELLYFLTSNSKLVFSKEILYEKIWGENTFGDIKTFDNLPEI